MEHKILIIGGGTAGIIVAAQLKRADSSLDIAILDPADNHFYQPAWTLVGANTFDYKKTLRPMSSVIPKGVTWIKEAADKLDPENNQITTTAGKTISYEYLVMAPGLVMKPELIEGLPEAIDKGVVCSNYTDPEHT